MMAMELLTHKNAPFVSVGLDSNFNPPGYAEYHRTHDWIPPCDQYGGGTWLKPGTYTYKLGEYKKALADEEAKAEEDDFRIIHRQDGQRFLIQLRDGDPTHCVLWELKEVERDITRAQAERCIYE